MFFSLECVCVYEWFGVVHLSFGLFALLERALFRICVRSSHELYRIARCTVAILGAQTLYTYIHERAHVHDDFGLRTQTHTHTQNPMCIYTAIRNVACNREINANDTLQCVARSLRALAFVRREWFSTRAVKTTLEYLRSQHNTHKQISQFLGADKRP